MIMYKSCKSDDDARSIMLMSYPSAGVRRRDHRIGRAKPKEATHRDVDYEINVVAAWKDLDSILAMWKQMLRLRKQYRDVLVYGSFEVYNMEDPKVFTYVNSFEDTEILVALNFSSEEQEIPPSFKERTVELLVPM
jgi:glycosidase